MADNYTEEVLRMRLEGLPQMQRDLGATEKQITELTDKIKNLRSQPPNANNVSDLGNHVRDLQTLSKQAASTREEMAATYRVISRGMPASNNPLSGFSGNLAPKSLQQQHGELRDQYEAERRDLLNPKLARYAPQTYRSADNLRQQLDEMHRDMYRVGVENPVRTMREQIRNHEARSGGRITPDAFRDLEKAVAGGMPVTPDSDPTLRMRMERTRLDTLRVEREKQRSQTEQEAFTRQQQQSDAVRRGKAPTSPPAAPQRPTDASTSTDVRAVQMAAASQNYVGGYALDRRNNEARQNLPPVPGLPFAPPRRPGDDITPGVPPVSVPQPDDPVSGGDGANDPGAVRMTRAQHRQALRAAERDARNAGVDAVRTARQDPFQYAYANDDGSLPSHVTDAIARKARNATNQTDNAPASGSASSLLDRLTGSLGRISEFFNNWYYTPAGSGGAGAGGTGGGGRGPGGIGPGGAGGPGGGAGGPGGGSGGGGYGAAAGGGNPPISGCTDPNASNYNPHATVDDGSCTYTPKKTASSVGRDILDMTGITDIQDKVRSARDTYKAFRGRQDDARKLYNKSYFDHELEREGFDTRGPVREDDLERPDNMSPDLRRISGRLDYLHHSYQQTIDSLPYRDDMTDEQRGAMDTYRDTLMTRQGTVAGLRSQLADRTDDRVAYDNPLKEFASRRRVLEARAKAAGNTVDKEQLFQAYQDVQAGQSKLDVENEETQNAIDLTSKNVFTKMAARTKFHMSRGAGMALGYSGMELLQGVAQASTITMAGQRVTPEAQERAGYALIPGAMGLLGTGIGMLAGNPIMGGLIGSGAGQALTGIFSAHSERDETIRLGAQELSGMMGQGTTATEKFAQAISKAADHVGQPVAELTNSLTMLGRSVGGLNVAGAANTQANLQLVSGEEYTRIVQSEAGFAQANPLALGYQKFARGNDPDAGRSSFFDAAMMEAIQGNPDFTTQVTAYGDTFQDKRTKYIKTRLAANNSQDFWDKAKDFGNFFVNPAAPIPKFFGQKGREKDLQDSLKKAEDENPDKDKPTAFAAEAQSVYDLGRTSGARVEEYGSIAGTAGISTQMALMRGEGPQGTAASVQDQITAINQQLDQISQVRAGLVKIQNDPRTNKADAEMFNKEIAQKDQEAAQARAQILEAQSTQYRRGIELQQAQFSAGQSVLGSQFGTYELQGGSIFGTGAVQNFAARRAAMESQSAVLADQAANAPYLSPEERLAKKSESAQLATQALATRNQYSTAAVSETQGAAGVRQSAIDVTRAQTALTGNPTDILAVENARLDDQVRTYQQIQTLIQSGTFSLQQRNQLQTAQNEALAQEIQARKQIDESTSQQVIEQTQLAVSTARTVAGRIERQRGTTASLDDRFKEQDATALNLSTMADDARRENDPKLRAQKIAAYESAMTEAEEQRVQDFGHFTRTPQEQIKTDVLQAQLQRQEIGPFVQGQAFSTRFAVYRDLSKVVEEKGDYIRTLKTHGQYDGPVAEDALREYEQAKYNKAEMQNQVGQDFFSRIPEMTMGRTSFTSRFMPTDAMIAGVLENRGAGAIGGRVFGFNKNKSYQDIAQMGLTPSQVSKFAFGQRPGDLPGSVSDDIENLKFDKDPLGDITLSNSKAKPGDTLSDGSGLGQQFAAATTSAQGMIEAFGGLTAAVQGATRVLGGTPAGPGASNNQNGKPAQGAHGPGQAHGGDVAAPGSMTAQMLAQPTTGRPQASHVTLAQMVSHMLSTVPVDDSALRYEDSARGNMKTGPGGVSLVNPHMLMGRGFTSRLLTHMVNPGEMDAAQAVVNATSVDTDDIMDHTHHRTSMGRGHSAGIDLGLLSHRMSASDLKKYVASDRTHSASTDLGLIGSTGSSGRQIDMNTGLFLQSATGHAHMGGVMPAMAGSGGQGPTEIKGSITINLVHADGKQTAHTINIGNNQNSTGIQRGGAATAPGSQSSRF